MSKQLTPLLVASLLGLTIQHVAMEPCRASSFENIPFTTTFDESTAARINAALDDLFGGESRVYVVPGTPYPADWWVDYGRGRKSSVRFSVYLTEGWLWGPSVSGEGRLSETGIQVQKSWVFDFDIGEPIRGGRYFLPFLE